jgi:hypothetical protein
MECEECERRIWVHKLMKCEECERVFDLFDETDSQEWFYGHDCETQETENS